MPLRTVAQWHKRVIVDATVVGSIPVRGCCNYYYKCFHFFALVTKQSMALNMAAT